MPLMSRLPADSRLLRIWDAVDQDRAAIPSNCIATPTVAYAELAPYGDVTDFGGGPVGVGAA